MKKVGTSSNIKHNDNLTVMKKLIMMSGLAILLMASCKDNEKPLPPPPPPVENPAPPVTPEPQTPVNPVKTTTTTRSVEEENPDGTSVSINGDGVSFKNKNGEKQNDVTVSKKKTELTIKTN